MSITSEIGLPNPHSGVGPDKPLARRPYQKPAFLREGLLLETSALRCGKVSPTQAQCISNKKDS
jgi:hypothetical protein